MNRFWRNPLVWLLACFVASLCLLLYPLYVIRPFRHQGAAELSLALQVMRVRPALTIALSVFAALLAFRAWKHIHRLVPRLGLVLVAAFTVICSAFSFANVYELMFQPLRRPTFKNASSTHLNGAEQVIAVKLARASRAYPIRIISYHHIVNDVLADVPIVATY